MQTYQVHSSALSGCSHLSTACIDCSTDRSRSTRPAVPGSPGRARLSYPYPPSRRRRQ